jgi:hypothetical protein
MLKINYDNKSYLDVEYKKIFKNKKYETYFNDLKSEYKELKGLFLGFAPSSIKDEIEFILTASFKDLLQLSYNFNRIQLRMFLEDIELIKRDFPSKVSDIEKVMDSTIKESNKEILIDFYKLKKKIKKSFNETEIINFKEFDSFTNQIKSIFNYDKPKCKISKQQPEIADFFRKKHEKINLSTCYFCNLNAVNVFKINEYHKDAVDFIIRSTEEELTQIEGIGEKTAFKIKSKNITYIDTEETLKKVHKLNDNVIYKLKEARISLYDNFTLDHLLDKGKFPLIALSLYNFVPSCYTCNSKLKGSKQFISKTGQTFLSPTSNDFKLSQPNETLFGLFFKNKEFEGDFSPIKKIEEFRIDFNHPALDEYEEYIYTFKLKGRYNYRYIKNEIFDMIEKSRLYPQKQIDEINDILQNSNNSSRLTKEIIFGQELFQIKKIKPEAKPLLKLKWDIAKKLGILK